MGVEVPGHPAGAHPHKGSYEKPDSSLHGYLSTTNRVPIHDRGASLPPPNKIQNAVSRGVRMNEGPSRPPQHLQEPDGVTWIPRLNAMSSLRNHTEGPSISLVQQTSAILDLVLQRALYRVRLSLHWSSDIQEAELSPANHQAAAIGEPEVLRPKVQPKFLKVDVPNEKLAITAFIARLGVQSKDLMFSISKNPQATMTEVLAKAEKYINGEEALTSKRESSSAHKEKSRGDKKREPSNSVFRA